jgi:hypothetical protein
MPKVSRSDQSLRKPLYERLWWEHREAEMEQLVGMREWLDKFEKRVG